MEKLIICRICLVENVRMHVVAYSHLQTFFEKLTNIPFITEDSRPMLACFFCYARLKQCYKFWQKCVEAEAVFTQMLDEEYEQKPLQAEVEFFGGFLKTPIVHVNIEELGQQEDDEGEDKEDIEGELPGGCERIDDVEIKAEYHSDGFEDKSMRIVFQSDSENDIPLARIKTGVELVKKKKRTTKKEREARKKSAPVVKKPKLDIRKENLENTISTKDEKNEQANLKVIDRTESSKIKSVTKIRELIKSNPSNNINIHDLKCNYRGIDSHNIKKHGLNHSNLYKEKPYKCDVCHNSFIHKGALKRHIRIHTGEKPYKCDVCGRSFNVICNLKIHIRTHTGEKPYKCDVCHISFIKNENLKRHMRVHSGEKPYKCDICQNSFIKKCNLKRHIRAHTGEKPFKCDICQSSFIETGNLKRHIRIHTGEKPYKCNVCQSSFNQKCNLKGHLLTHRKKTI